MRFSSNAPTTPTTTTSVDMIEGKRGSTTTAPHEQPIQVVEIDMGSGQLNGTANQQQPQSPSPSTPSEDVSSLHVQEIINASCEFTKSPPAPPLHENNGNV